MTVIGAILFVIGIVAIAEYIDSKDNCKDCSNKHCACYDEDE